MDVHRCRFVDYIPHAITSLAFSHKSSPPNKSKRATAPKSLRLAVGRSNGDIEIWNPHSSWIHETTLRGGRGRSIEGLAWAIEDPVEASDGVLNDQQSNNEEEVQVANPRLFSIGGSQMVTEWDLQTGLPRVSFDSNSGVIWSISVSPAGDKLALGCDNGSIVIVDISGGPGVLSYMGALQRQKSRIMSVAWKNNNEIVGSCGDGRIRVWSVEKSTSSSSMVQGRVIATMTVDKSKDEDTLVWSVLVLNNGRTIVSGDSTGSVKFWNGNNYTLQQTFRAHASDVLCLSASADNNAVFSSGVDKRIVNYKLVDASGKGNKRRWAVITNRLLHSHDVRALAIYESKGSSFLISGGVERSIVVNSAKDFMDGMFRKIPITPQRPRVSTNKIHRSLLMFSDHEVKVWGIDAQKEPIDGSKAVRKELRMKLSSDENITSVSLSNDPMLLVVSTVAEIKIFRLSLQEDGYEVERIPCPKDLSDRGARLVEFSPDSGKLAVVTSESYIVIYQIRLTDDNNEITFEKVQEIDVPSENVASSDMPSSEIVSILCWCPSGERFAIATIGGDVKIFSSSTATKKDTPFEEYWSLPRFDYTPTAMTFTTDNCLVVVTAETRVYEFNLTGKCLSNWSKRNSDLLPSQFVSLVDKCCGVFYEQGEKNKGRRIWLWGANWLAFLDLQSNFSVTTNPRLQFGPSKRKRDQLGINNTDNKQTSAKWLNKRLAAEGMLGLPAARRQEEEEEGEEEEEEETKDNENEEDDEEQEGSENDQVSQNGHLTNGTKSNINGFSHNGNSTMHHHHQSNRVPFWITFKYRPLLLVDCISNNELVVVERPPFDIPLPPAFFNTTSHHQFSA